MVTLPSPATSRIARAVHVRGLVQGVGFRPFVHRLALRHALHGIVRNESGSVYIEVEGDQESVAGFLHELETAAPPMARLTEVSVGPLALTAPEGFRIVPSAENPAERLPVAPDLAMCSRCEAELFDPANRRYRYPFITCTDCGPRYTVITAMPYDRDRTTMRVFPACQPCRFEYVSPEDRRYHSETNSCPDCGPTLWLVEPGTNRETRPADPALERAAELLRAGCIVALRGLGGFHLAVDATSESAVRRLRERKHREAKPLAIMVRNVSAARRLASLGDAERKLLTSPERPVVLLERRPEARLAPSIAPGLDTIGVLTPYTPLHHLVLERVRGPLVMTSGNVSDEPIITGNSEALQRLGTVADAFLLHDREIVSRYDDSVVRVTSGSTLMIRRARGYAPVPVRMPVATPRPIVATGPHLKNTVTLAQNDAAYVSQHIGDLESLQSWRYAKETLDTYGRLFHITPEVAACDRHPSYLSTRLAHELGHSRVVPVQHHHAHIAAVAGEHGVTGPVLGLAYDGTGYGDDGAIWGGEVLVADLLGYRRVAHLRYAQLPGGDLAARTPWRSALAFLSLDPAALREAAYVFDPVDRSIAKIAKQQIARRVNAVPTSSMGRLFDAAAAILGVRLIANYEGQAAMELEAMVPEGSADPFPFPVVESGEGWQLDPVPLLRALVTARSRGENPATLAARFHESLAEASADVACRARERFRIGRVALGGGVFQNARLFASLSQRLRVLGFEVLHPLELGPNDGAISYGQAVVAAATLAREERR